MISPERTTDETYRLADLQSYAVLDTPPEACFDRITRLAASYFGTPHALITLIDDDRQFCKSCHGTDFCDIPRDLAFCSHAILENGVLVVPDASKDRRFSGNPIVTGHPNIRFYAGAPLITPHGSRIGALCIFDMKPRAAFDDDDRSILRDMADIVIDELELRNAVTQRPFMPPPCRKRRSDDQVSRESQEKPRESERRFQNLYNKMPAMMHSIDQDIRIVSVSDFWLETLGYSREEVLGRKSINFLTDESRRYVTKVTLPEFRRTGTSKDIELQFVKKNGEPLDVLLSAKSELDETGAFTRSIAVLTDITAKKAAEETLRENEARFRFLYNNTPALLHAVDKDWRITNVSDYWLETLGYRREEVIGRFSTDFLTAESAAKAKQTGIPNLLRNGSSGPKPYQYVKKTGEIIDVILSSIIQRGEDGEVAAVITVLTDVTKLKAVEAQLVQSQKMEAVGQLTGGLAHDFNNLLAIVIGNLQLLDRVVKDDESVRRKVSSALKAAQRGADLTQRLLAFSRRQTLESEPVDANELISGMTDLLQRTLGANVELKVSLTDDIWLTTTDTGQLESAILNLAVNARDAMNEGGILTIGTAMTFLDDSYAAARNDVGTGDYIVISVSDTGSGMSPEIVENIFQPFFTTKEVGRGTGLGLSMVYGFAKQTGGHIEVHSEPDHGTTIELYLPRCKIEETRIRSGEATVGPVVGGSETILVVEDDDEVRDMTVALLNKLGYRVLTAENGRRAMQIIEGTADIDLLFTDIVMPGGMDGAELALKAIAMRPGLNVVYASGFADAAVLEKSKVRTRGVLLPKPFQRSDLARTVRGALDGKTPGRAPE